MRKNSKTNSHLVKNKEFIDIRSKKIDLAFKNLLALGEEIEGFTSQIKAEVNHQKVKTELAFLQKLKPKISKLAQFYQEELACIETIKHCEAEISSGKPAPQLLPIPLFILEEKTWKNFGLASPWAELKLQKQTLLELAIENEIEKHSHSLSALVNEEEQFNQQIATWKQELALLGVSVQYKVHTKLRPDEFEALLNRFAIENQSDDTELELNLTAEQAQFRKPDPVKIEDIDVKVEIEHLVAVTEDPHSVDKFLQEMESLTLDLEEEILIHPTVELAEPDDYQPKRPEKKRIANIDLTTVDQEMDELLNPPKSNIGQTKPVAGYLKRLLTGTLGMEEEITVNNEPVFDSPVEELNDKQRQLAELEREIEDAIGKMDAVIKGSTNCDTRLLEYLRVRTKNIARLLLEQDILSHNQQAISEQEVEHYVDANLPQKTITLLTELLDPIKASLIANINQENQSIVAYNKKYKKNKSLKALDEYEWRVFSKKLLESVVS
jgi:hypothetical protein